MSRTQLSSLTFTIDGHTDARGSEAFNLELSNRRADAAVAYLETLGVPMSRLTAKGFGETSPRVDDPLAAINRRVEAKIRLEQSCGTRITLCPTPPTTRQPRP
ncbi:MAG: OmpA family protein [Pseudomonadota bacterium]